MEGRNFGCSFTRLAVAMFVILILSTSSLIISYVYNNTNQASQIELKPEISSSASKVGSGTGSGTRASDEVLMEKGWINQCGPTEAAAWGDIDNDGYLDLAIARYNKEVIVYKNRNGTLDKTPYWQSYGKFYGKSIAWGDLNNDGYLDIAVGCAYYGNGSHDQKRFNLAFRNIGGYLEDNPYWYSGDKRNTSDICWVDFDSDGDLDLAAGNFGTNGKNVIYENRDNTLKSNPVWVSKEDDWTEAIAFGDLDSDGDLDLVVGNNFGQPNQIYFNQLAGLDNVATWSSEDSTATLDIALGDINGDGYLDIVAGTSDNAMCIVYTNLFGTFAFNYDWSVTHSWECTSVSLGDVDSDGDLDLAQGCQINGLKKNNYVYLNKNSSLEKTYSWESNEATVTTDIDFADIDLDGDLDLLAVNNGSIESNWLYINGVDLLPTAHGLLPNNHVYGKISTPHGINSGTIGFNLTLYDKESSSAYVKFEYSINDEDWQKAKQWTGPGYLDLNNLSATPNGKILKFNWDTSNIKLETNNVKCRALIFEKNSRIGIYRYSAIVVETQQFNYGNAPTTPNGLSVEGITINSAVLFWEENPITEYVIGYEIFINKTDSTNEYEILADVKGITMFQVENLAENTSYYFKLAAYDNVPFKSPLTQRLSCRTYNNPPKTKPDWSTIKIIIPEDGEDNSSLDLSQIFHDTTGDPLYYNYQETKNFTITVHPSGKVIIVPKEDWFGKENLIFEARDGQNTNHPPGETHYAQIQQEVEVEGLNDPPKIIQSLGTITMDEDPENGTHINLLSYFDDSADKDSLTFRVQGQQNLTINYMVNSFIEIIPIKNWYGEEKLTIYAKDSVVEVSDSLMVIVQPVNDAPEIKTLTMYWPTGKWNNFTFDISDPDKEDILQISTNLQEIFPHLVPNENFLINPATGKGSIYVTKKMVGDYKFNVTVNDGTTLTTGQISLKIVIEGGDVDGKGGEATEKFDYLTFVLIPIIIIIVILIILIFAIRLYKKSQKISFIKCPSCGHSVVTKGRGAVNCEGCGASIDPGQLRQTAPTTKTSAHTPVSGRVAAPQTDQHQTIWQPDTMRVSGGYYPKSILEGSVLDQPDQFDQPIQTTPEPVIEKKEIPMAVPIAKIPSRPIVQTQTQHPIQQQPSQPQANQQARAQPVQTTRPTPTPAPTPTTPQPAPQPQHLKLQTSYHNKQ